MSSGWGLPGQRISKKLIARVRPGVELVRATLSPTRELMTLDLPTLERPRKAISGRLGTGNCAASVADARNRERTLMLKFATRGGWLASAGGRPVHSPQRSLITHDSRLVTRGETVCS